MNINDIHDFVYEGDEDYELDDLDPDSFEVRIGIELVTGGSALMTVQADSKDDAVDALEDLALLILAARKGAL